MKDEKIRHEKDKLLFGVRRSIRYHNHRRRHFDFINKFTTIIAALSGSATVISVLSKLGQNCTITFAVIVAVMSAVDLVLGTAQKAREHNDLAKRFFDLEKAIITIKEITEEDLSRLTTQRLDIEADEPPVLQVLDCICHNELLRAMGYDQSKHVKIKWYQRLFRNFIDIRGHTIQLQ